MLFILVTNFVSRRFRRAVCFSCALPYINPSRASPSLVVRENDRIVLANVENRRQTAVFLTMGVVSECHPVTPGYFGSMSTYLGRRICIYPLHIEYQRAAAFIGMALKHEVKYTGPLFNGTISFSTRKDVGSGSGITSPSTLSHPGRAALQFHKQVQHGTSYPGSLGFNEKGMSSLLHVHWSNAYLLSAYIRCAEQA